MSGLVAGITCYSIRDRELLPKHNNKASNTGAVWAARAHPTALEQILRTTIASGPDKFFAT